MANMLGQLDTLSGGGDGSERVDNVPAQSADNKAEQFRQSDMQSTSKRVVGSEVSSSSEHPKESVFWIETAKIKPNPEQPRSTFDELKIKALAESIRQYGVLQPIIVSKREIDVPTGTQVEYQIIAGERRFRAAQMIGLAHMPAVIRREESDRIKLELALIENLQREDLNPLEKARAYKRLVSEFGLNVLEVGLQVGKSREAVSNTMRLLLLPAYMQEALAAGAISEGQARPLISLAASSGEQRSLFERVMRDGLGAREVEHAARQIAVETGLVVRPRKKTDRATHDTTTRSYETKLADALGTRVSVKQTRSGRGRISIEFFSNEELQNLLTRIAVLQAEGGVKAAGTDGESLEEGGSTVVIYPPTGIDNTIGVGGSEQSDGAARPEDLSTFTV